MKPSCGDETSNLSYMRITRLSVGYLINFGHKDTLERKRFILTAKK